MDWHCLYIFLIYPGLAYVSYFVGGITFLRPKETRGDSVGANFFWCFNLVKPRKPIWATPLLASAAMVIHGFYLLV